MFSGLAILEFHQPGHGLLRVIYNAPSLAFFPENLSKSAGIGAGALIPFSESADIPLLHAGEVLIQLCVKILPVSVPQCDAHAEVDDGLHSRAEAVVQQTPEIFFGVIEKRQDGTQPYTGTDTVFPPNVCTTRQRFEMLNIMRENGLISGFAAFSSSWLITDTGSFSFFAA